MSKSLWTIFLLTSCGLTGLPGQDPAMASCARTSPGWIWCDDFEIDRSGSYFEVSTAGGAFVRTPGAGWNGSTGMRVQFRPGQVDAGFLHLAFGRTPQTYFRPVTGGATDYREIWWRIRLGFEPGWVGGGGVKISRATSFASPDHWGQSMIAHLWSGGTAQRDLVLDPATGVDGAGELVTTTYNDFARLRWLGAEAAKGIFSDLRGGQWFCVEVHVRLNDRGMTNGVFELTVDGIPRVSRRALNWVGPFAAYGINAVFLENYWNDGAPAAQARVFDDFVVSTAPIGCG